jgi:hypothetical protein
MTVAGNCRGQFAVFLAELRNGPDIPNQGSAGGEEDSELPYYRVQSTFFKLNSVALVRKRTIPTERPPHMGEVSVNFCR